MPNQSTSSMPSAPDPIQTQIVYMSIMTATRHADFGLANQIVNEFTGKYGTMLPLLVCAASFGNSILDTYAKAIGEEPEAVLQTLALEQLQKKPPGPNRAQRRKGQQ